MKGSSSNWAPLIYTARSSSQSHDPVLISVEQTRIIPRLAPIFLLSLVRQSKQNFFLVAGFLNHAAYTVAAENTGRS
jgi:hypothetical protein